MDNIPPVEVVDGVEHLPDGLRGVLLGEFAIFADAVEQFASSGQLGDNVEFVLGFEPVHKGDDVWVLEFLQHLQLVIYHAFVAAHVFLEDDLDGDLGSILSLRLPDNTICACA